MAIPRTLTIATSDSGGGAGIRADLKAFAAAGVYGTSALVARPKAQQGPGSFHVNLYDALAALDPATLTARAKVETA